MGDLPGFIMITRQLVQESKFPITLQTLGGANIKITMLLACNA